jgi:hypothetical protein
MQLLPPEKNQLVYLICFDLKNYYPLKETEFPDIFNARPAVF